jgi:CRP/FNR family transcriptional regulator
MARSITSRPQDGNGGAPHREYPDPPEEGAPRPRLSSMLPGEGKRKRFSAKEVIYREGDAGARVYLVRSGLVKLLSYLPNGRARIVRLHVRDHWIGLEGLLRQPYDHTAIAVDDVEIDYFPSQSVQRHHHENPMVLGEMLCQWHEDLGRADKWISDFSTGGIRARVARLIEYLAELEHGHSAGWVELLTVHEIAEILGVTQESVSRILAGFKRRDILRKQPSPLREIYRLDTEKLHQQVRE